MPILSEMAFGGGERLGKVFADKVGGEAGPGGEVASVNCFSPSGGDWAESCAM